MNNFKNYLGEILNLLDRSLVLDDLNPKDSGRYVTLTCPKCKQNTAYISKNGYYIHCNRKNNCGYSEGLLDYLSDRDKVSDDETILKLAQITGVSIPELSEEESEQFKRTRDRQRLYKDILATTKFGLWKYGADVVEYLRNRSYADTEILNMDFGYLPIVSELETYLIYKKHSPALVSEVISSFRPTHKLIIPIFNPSGIIDGFVTRTIDDTITPKYLYSKGLTRGSYFINSYEVKNNDTIIIVEGIIDALLLTEKGIKGVVACGSSAPTNDQLNSILKSKYVKNIVLCLDNDQAGLAGTEKTIDMLKNRSVRVYVANTLPYKDPDEFVKYEGLDKYIDNLRNSVKSTKWLVNRIIEKYDDNTDIGRETALDYLLDLHNSLVDPLDEELLVNTIQSVLGLSLESISQKIQLFNEIKSKENLKEAYKDTLNQANKYLYSNNFDDLDLYLKDKLEKIKSINSIKTVSQYYTYQAIDDIQNRQDSLKTGYNSLDNHISIHNGAITLVAGRPSHGKTTFLLNLFTNMIKLYSNKSFFYFSYEESKTALYIKLINLLSGELINNKNPNSNTQQIEYYIKGNNQSVPAVNQSMQLYDSFVKENRLWLIDEPLDVESLTSTISNLKTRFDIGAVFIDYAQRIKYSGKYETERVKIARISETLRESATRLDLPYIIGTQLNRDNAKSKPQLENLKEAGNLEEDANLALGIYNWKTALSKEQTENNNSLLTNCKGKQIQIDDRQIDFEVHVLKNRNGSINENALLKFDAPLLKISECYIPHKTYESIF